MTRGSWEPGDVVVWRETWHGHTYFVIPERVVADDDRGLALYTAEGTPFHFPPGAWPFEGEHPWLGRAAWTGHGVLVLYRAGDAHTIFHFWEGEERRIAGWYVDMQDPLVRDGKAFDTQDHELDLWIEPDGSWQWKDEEKMADWVRHGRFTLDEVAAIRAEGERVLAEWPFPTGWEHWEPDPAWPVPALPDGWASA